MLREIFRDINKKDSPYKDIYYLTDTEIRFTINDNRFNRILIYSIRKENNKYIAYMFEKSNLNNKQNVIELENINQFWDWFITSLNNN